ncbi:MAG TPA: intradiol ring-cleavage dioxygenase [Niabella sp.]|nr:intradiol ring-cleavage dioxygenase [Niabella sp.]
MERKKFLSQSLTALGVAFVAPITKACSKTDVIGDTDETGSGSCTTTPSETEGPFPTKSPSALVQSNIAGDRTGVPLSVKIYITNRNNSCAALANAIVDIWHCDAAGNYSEYGGTGMQSTNYTSVHWLRGRQTTGSNGLVTFTSIFPGWYSGRAPHIHVHVYNSSGRSLLVTQIAFPTDICNTVYTTASPYSTRGTQDTQNSRDNVFADSLDFEMSAVTGSVSEGYTLTHTINVSA